MFIKFLNLKRTKFFSEKNEIIEIPAEIFFIELFLKSG